MKRLLGLVLLLLPVRLRAAIGNAAFNTLPEARMDGFRRALHAADVAWSFRNLKRKGFAPRLIVDIGAYDGRWTRMIKGVFPESRVFMIDAQSAKQPALEAVKVQFLGTADYAISLLAAESGRKIDFQQMESGSSVFAEQSNVPRSTISLDTRTLDELLTERDLGGPALLKLDVQGYELEILKGAAQALSQAEVVLLETSLLAYNRDAPQLSDVVRFMDERGFCVYDICSLIRCSHLSLEELDDTLVHVDLLFVRKTSSWRPTHFRFHLQTRPEG